jgi:hypothetical protein
LQPGEEALFSGAPERQDTQAGARASGGGSLGLLPEEDRGNPGMARAAQIMSIVGAVAGKSPAGRGLQAAGEMMGQQAQPRTDRMAQLRERMETYVQATDFTVKTARQIRDLELAAGKEGSPTAQQKREDYARILPGGVGMLDEIIANHRSFGGGLGEIVKNSDTAAGILQATEGDYGAVIDEALKNPKIIQEHYATIDQRNLEWVPAHVDSQFQEAYDHFPERIDDFKECGSTFDCYLKHIDQKLTDAPLQTDPENAKRLDTPRNGYERESGLDTIRRNPEAATNGRVFGPIASTERVEVTDRETNKSLGSFRKDDPRLKQYEANPRYHIGTFTGSKEEVLGKRAQGDMEASLIKVGNARDRMIAIRQTHMPDVHRFLGKIKASTISFRDFMSGVPLVGKKASKEELRFLTDFSMSMTTLLSNLTTTLNELSGAAVSPEEGKRIAKTMPNPDDSNAVKLAKAEARMIDFDYTVARHSLYVQQGSDGQPWKLTRIDVAREMNEATHRAYRALKDERPDMDDKKALANAVRQTERTFGISEGGYRAMMNMAIFEPSLGFQ